MAQEIPRFTWTVHSCAVLLLMLVVRHEKADRIHLARVAELGCIVSKNLNLGETPAEIHLIRIGQGTSQRAAHRKSIPLCHTHHRNGGYGVAIHAGRRASK